MQTQNHTQNQDREQHAHIVGWGADLDRSNRPAYPMERTPGRLERMPWTEPPEPQRKHVEVLRSNERPTLTPVFGSTCPPRGLSGVVRRSAFGFSENDLRHWLLLLLADRVDVGEGLIEDLAHGHLPRVYSEMGGAAELKHNPKGAARKALTLVALVGVAYLALRRRRG
ncbi:hypothetical protein [Variovorax sp. J22R115]|uniref:hypothetical protein n=1 Tax=Variovorax sp. J22R115 TaxID=3053509 RepID=UPI002575843C|nr:hypothetical protein [Variovorax sp. J22R115]MDM0049945.1 hypothetical protein [Variovorax sp. J22R115]